ncbi:putative sulfate transporter/MT1781 [bacterium BMS3Abin01]|nr:putative sulfate transporter/MT1781 [bacterium BMS3Abin01]
MPACSMLALLEVTGHGRQMNREDLFNPKTLVNDATAGLTLGIESIPDAMASALLAAANPINGLYAVMLATPVGALFASSVFMSVQTTSAMSLVVADVPQVHTSDDPTGALFMLAILTGIIMLTMGLLKLGFVLRFVSNAVMTGFINGVALLIILGQLDNLTGFSSEESNKILRTFNLLRNLGEVHSQTLIIGLVTILLIVVLSRTKLKSFGMVLALIVASLMVPIFSWDTVARVADIAEIPNSLPHPVLPSFSMIPALLIPAFSLAFVGLVQGAGVSQNYVNPDGEYPDSSGDFRGQGVANIAAGFFQGMPVGGSLSATALVHSSGARTRFANIFAGIIIAVSLLLFGDAVSALAMPSLAGLLIVVGFQTLKPDDIVQVWKTGQVQKLVLVTTFASTLIIPLQYAVLLGVILSTVLFVIRQSNKITIKQWVFEPGQVLPIEKDPPEVLPSNQVTILRPYGSLFYAAASVFEEQLPEIMDDTRHAVMILNLRGREELGSTFLEVIERYSDNLKQQECRLMLSEVKPELYEQMRDTGHVDAFAIENFFIRTRKVGEATIAAYRQALDWVEAVSERKPESP